MYAPYGTCPKCGWSGKYWGFKYHSLCKSCYKQWRKEKAEEDQKYKLPNNNVKLSDSIVVTEHVYNRLQRQAERAIGKTYAYWLARIIPLTIGTGAIFLMKRIDPNNGVGLSVIMFGGFFLAALFFYIFQSAWEQQVNIKVNELATVRKQDIEEQLRFYNSPE